MHLGLYHEPVHTDGRTFDTYGPYARYVLEFARHFDRVTVFAPTTDKPTYFSGHPLDAGNVNVVPLPFFETHAQAYRRAGAIVRAFRRNCGDLDVINCRQTAPLGYVLWLLTRKRGVPFIYHFSSDPFEIIANNPKYRGLYGRFARCAYGMEFAIQKHIMRRNYSFTDGQALCDRLIRYTPNIEPIVLSSLTREDYFLRDDSCLGPVVRLIYVGYLRHGKGLNDLVEAVRLLRQAGRNVELDMVGSGEQLEPLIAQARAAGVADYVHFRGQASMGPQLNAYYNAADLFVLPSLSEGSPRVILEALAHSLPVIATDVGNISQQLDAGRRGLLIPRNDPQAIAAAAIRFMDDAEFRRQCIRDGYAFARQHGLETFIARMADKAKELVAQRRGEVCK